MYSILDVIKWLKMNESTLFGMKSKCNNVYPLLQVFQALLLFPCFMVRNPFCCCTRVSWSVTLIVSPGLP